MPKLLQIEIMKSILTGSYAYGTPTRKSDIDIVILCNKETADILNEQLRPDSYFRMSHPSVDNSIRQGKINLIIETREIDFNIWVEGTEQLVAKKPVTRDEAVHTFATLRKNKQTNSVKQNKVKK